MNVRGHWPILVCSGRGGVVCGLLSHGFFWSWDLTCTTHSSSGELIKTQGSHWGGRRVYLSLSSLSSLFKSLHRLNWTLLGPGCYGNSHMTPQTALLGLSCYALSSLKGSWSLRSEMHRVPQLTTPWANRDLQRAWEKTYQDHRKKVGRHLEPRAGGWGDRRRPGKSSVDSEGQNGSVFLTKEIFYFMCMNALLSCMSVYHLHT